MNLRNLILFLAPTLLVLAAHGEPFVFETATLGTTGQPAGGAAANSFQFLGAKFDITGPTEIDQLGGHLSGSTSNSVLFVAVVPLDPETDLPATFDLSDALFATTFVAQLPLTRSPSRPISHSPQVATELSLVLDYSAQTAREPCPRAIPK